MRHLFLRPTHLASSARSDFVVRGFRALPTELNDLQWRRHTGRIAMPPELVDRILHTQRGVCPIPSMPTEESCSNRRVLGLRNNKLWKHIAQDRFQEMRDTQQPIQWDEVHGSNYLAIAHMMVRMPLQFGAVARACLEIEKYLPEFFPKTLIDYGSGPGTAFRFASDPVCVVPVASSARLLTVSRDTVLSKRHGPIQFPASLPSNHRRR